MARFDVQQRAALDALCRRIVPVAFAPDAPRVELAAAVESRLASGDPALAAQVGTLLSLFDHPLTALLFTGRPRRFTTLGADDQDAWLRAWGRSRLPLRRTVYQALRRVILSTFYAMPVSHPAIGFRGPLHRREPVVAWEGPLTGPPSDADPVARTGDRESDSTLHRAVAPGPAPRGITQGHEARGDVALTADVCVIGTGAGGAVVSARLAEAGYDVVVIEEGGYWTAADFTEEEAEMVPRLYAERGARATDDLAISLLQGRCVGGSTTINWMIMLRTREWVLDEWARDHGTEGMRAADLSPVFDLIEEETHARLVTPDAHAPGNRIIIDGAAALGWSAPPAKINARDCIRAGFCGIGCRYGAKQSTLVTYVPRALAAGARLRCDVRVDRVEQVERGGSAPLKRVHGTVLDRETHEPRHRITVDAPIVVLAAGAVGSPVILQRSGLGGGGVGRYLRLHPTSAVIGVYAREMYGTAGIPQSALADEFLRGEDGYGFWIECPSLLPGLASVAVPGFGDEHRRVMERFPQLGSLIVLARDGAERGKSSGDVLVDRRGRVRIRYALGERDARTLHDGLAAATRLHLAAGAQEVLTLHEPGVRVRAAGDIARIASARRGPNRLSVFSAHVNGTCRIGTDPRTSGVNPHAERHGVPGLYVADGSIFPTAPGVNPQETIMALATIIARRIIDRHPAGRAGSVRRSRPAALSETAGSRRSRT
jgi:choline dehydrogenase-like flavoprotein